jgi:DNA-binding CsgD family transcriptional regulator
MQRRLTPRQLEVTVMLAMGQTSQEIAESLGISYLTVRTHLESARSVAGVGSLTQLVSWYWRNLKQREVRRCHHCGNPC